MNVDRQASRRPGLLYPMLVIAAVAVITFSVLGIVTMLGWLSAAPPSATGGESQTLALERHADRTLHERAFPCAECALFDAQRTAPADSP